MTTIITSLFLGLLILACGEEGTEPTEPPGTQIGTEDAVPTEDTGFDSTVDSDMDAQTPNDTIEGRWLWSSGTGQPANTMYEYTNGTRHTYYCDDIECDDAYWISLTTEDSIPGTNDYTLIDDVLTVDLHFGNYLVSPITFDCAGDRVNIEDPGYYLVRVNADLEDC